MADSFINKLTESTTVKGTDFTAFDIADPTTGGFFTKKVSFDNLTSKIKTEVNTSVQTQIDNLQRNLNTVSQSIANKLDKNGLTFAPTERMNGTLSVNATLSGFGETHFNQKVDVHNNFIVNVKDPVLDYDAVNLKTVNTKISQISIPNTANYVLKSGDTMTGALVLNADPTLSLHSVTKQYADKFNPFGKFLPLSGGSMTGLLNLRSFSEKYSLFSTAAGSLPLNLDNGNTFEIILTGNITGFTITGTIPSDSYSITMFIKQTGGFTVNWIIDTIAVKWAEGIAPTLASSGKYGVFAFTKLGTNWFGFNGGQNF